MENNNHFKIYSKIQTHNNQNITKEQDDETYSNNEPLILEGIASTTSSDLEMDNFTPECIQEMKNQALNLNIHCDHEKSLKKVIGTVISVEDTDDTNLKILFKIIPSISPLVKERLENDVKLGLSVRGLVKDYTTNKDNGWTVKSIQLMEISLTGLPANWDTFGTVQLHKNIVESKCLSGACALLRKSKSETNKEETKTLNKENTMTEPIKKTEEQVEKMDGEIFSPEQQQCIIDLINEALNNLPPMDENKSTESSESEVEKEEIATPDETEKLKQRIAELEAQLEEEKACNPKKEPKKSLTIDDLDSIISKVESKVEDNLVKNLEATRKPESKTDELVKEEELVKKGKEETGKPVTKSAREIAEIFTG